MYLALRVSVLHLKQFHTTGVEARGYIAREAVE
jgi:hypothetical protein